MNQFLQLELKRFVRRLRPGLLGASVSPNANLLQLTEQVKSDPKLHQSLQEAFAKTLPTYDFVAALTDSGLTHESGVFSEIFKRLEYKLLPKKREAYDIVSFLSSIFDSPDDAGWLNSLDRARLLTLFNFILPKKEELIEPLAAQVFAALEILSVRLANMGLDPRFLARTREKPEFHEAFLDITRMTQVLLDGGDLQAFTKLRGTLDKCAQGAGYVRSRRSTEGTSLALTYHLHKIQDTIRRFRLLLDLAEALLGEWSPDPGLQLFIEIVSAETQRFNLTSFLSRNAELLAYQVTEHTGRTGEHYITRTRSEWHSMLRSAAIGGVIVAFLAVIKILVSYLHLPPAPEALAFGILYASGFVTILSIGGTLATKQPAMTAARLAAVMDSSQSREGALENLCEIIVCTIRSQLIALFGNFVVAAPVAILVCFPLFWWGIPLMGPEKAQLVMLSLHPWKSLSFFYAAVAGIGLFSSGLLAGFVDNWYLFNDVGDRLKSSKFVRTLLPGPRLDRVIQRIDHNLSFWVGNVALGFYLGCMGPLGQVFGLPLDIRHITFASAQLGSALASLNFAVGWKTVVLLFASVFTMGLINLAVSFSLSLFVAIKSRRIQFAQTRELLRLLRARLIARPRDFFFPPADAK